MDTLKANALKIHMEEFPTYEEMEGDLGKVLTLLEESFQEGCLWGSGVKTVGDFTNKYQAYKNILMLINGLDKYLQQKVSNRVAHYVLTFVDEPVFALNYWEPEELVELLLPTLEAAQTEPMPAEKNVNLWGIREAFVRSQGVLTEDLEEEFLYEYCDVVCDEVLVYTVEYMVNEALKTGSLDVDMLLSGGLGVNVASFRRIFYNSAKEFDNMEDLSSYLVKQKDSYTHMGADELDMIN